MNNENQRLKTKLENKERRQSMSVKVYEFKLKEPSLKNKKYLDFLFIQSKWLYNFILSQEDIFKFDTKIKKISHKDKDGNNVETNLTLPAQIKQSTKEKIINAIKGLSVKKKRGKTKEVGKLKFKSNVNSIELKQYKFSHRYNFSNNTITFNKHTFKIYGLEQIKTDVEFANAFLIKKADGYYIHQTAYENKEFKNKEKEKAIGLDFGIKDSLTLSNGKKFLVTISETLRLKNLQRKLCRQTKRSKNWFKTKNKIEREYLYLTNLKNDKANKILSYLKNNFETIVFQDENLKGWHKGLFGKQVQNSILGRIKANLLNLENSIIVDRFFPSTKLCYSCGFKNKIELSERIFKCQRCGFEEDRDIKAAKTILFEGLKKSSSCGTQDYKCGENVRLLELELSDSKAILCEA